MTAVALPLRLPDEHPGPTPLDPPDDPREAEAWWLRRAIRLCRMWGGQTPAEASANASDAFGDIRWWMFDPPDLRFAVWLPEPLRNVEIDDLRARLAELEGEAQP